MLEQFGKGTGQGGGQESSDWSARAQQLLDQLANKKNDIPEPITHPQRMQLVFMVDDFLAGKDIQLSNPDLYENLRTNSLLRDAFLKLLESMQSGQFDS